MCPCIYVRTCGGSHIPKLDGRIAADKVRLFRAVLEASKQMLMSRGFSPMTSKPFFKYQESLRLRSRGAVVSRSSIPNPRPPATSHQVASGVVLKVPPNKPISTAEPHCHSN